jgi:hypothetical protein
MAFTRAVLSGVITVTALEAKNRFDRQARQIDATGKRSPPDAGLSKALVGVERDALSQLEHDDRRGPGRMSRAGVRGCLRSARRCGLGMGERIVRAWRPQSEAARQLERVGSAEELVRGL